MPNPEIKRYLVLWLAVTGALLLLAAVVNLLVDPYGLFRVVDQPGVNQLKPAATTHGALAKAYQVLRVQPRAIVLGNSRSEVGFNPNHPLWPAGSRPVYNLALPGSGTSTAVDYLRHVLANQTGANARKLTTIVWGIDFMDFLVDGQAQHAPEALKLGGGRLLVYRNGSLNTLRWQSQARDFGQSLITLDALLDSVQTVTSQGNPYAMDLTAHGFNPMAEYLKITADEGYWNVFRQRDEANTSAYARRPKRIFDASGNSSAPLEDMRQILQLCRQNGIDLRLVIYPYHAHLLEIIRITGHWPAFDAWKRAVVGVVTDEAASTGGKAVPLWDFSGFNAFTTETIPVKGDRQTKMRWYWEAGHFKSALGDLVLNRVFGAAGSVDLGTLLTPAMLDAHLLAMQAQEIDYRSTKASEVAELERMAEALHLRSERR